MEGFKNEFYAAAVIKDQPELFDGVEINGVSHDKEQEADGDGRHPVVVDNETPEFFSAYLRGKDGRAHSVCDVGTHAECLSWSNQLAARYGWTVTDLFAALHH
ncbi:hypothetical protein [Burkholderia phage FLC9]|nr:hypothetical protein [Burkholderia phage FLC9]